MANDYQYLTSTGVIVPDTASLRTTVEGEYRAALGADLVVTPDTPEGVLITAEVLARDAVVRNNAALANQINPNIAGGVFLDAIWALTGGERTQSTRSTAECTVTGANGTILNTVNRFRSATGELWVVTAAVTIGVSGVAVVPVRAIEYGPIAAPIGSITQIVISSIGLEAVTNLTAATLGTLAQSDAAVRALRKKTLALQGTGLPVAITSALYAVEGVRSLTFRENTTGGTLVIDGVSLVEHSIYACVDGGSDIDIATALLGTKSIGADFNGDVSVDVTDPSSGQVYNVLFARPDLIAVLIRVTCRVTNPLINPETAVRSAILAYTRGEIEGEDGFVVGGSVSSFELAGAINISFPNIYVQNLEIALAIGGAYTVGEIPIAIFEKATTTESSITVITP
jgi:hypothetical protein